MFKDVCTTDVSREGDDDLSDSSVVGSGVRVVIAGAWSQVSAGGPRVSPDVVSGLGDFCGMDAGLEGIAVRVGARLEGIAVRVE